MRLDLMIIMGSIIIIIINIIIIRVLLYFLQLSFNLLNIWCFFFFVSILQTLIIMNTTNHLNGSETRCFFFLFGERGDEWGKEREDFELLSWDFLLFQLHFTTLTCSNYCDLILFNKIVQNLIIDKNLIRALSPLLFSPLASPLSYSRL